MASSAKQQKLDGFFIKKQTNNGINTDLTQTVPTISDTNEEGPNEEVENEKIMKSFQTKWLKEHHWLRYDEEKNMMFCSICLDYNKDNAMTKGCNNFRTSTLTRHLKHQIGEKSIKFAPGKLFPICAFGFCLLFFFCSFFFQKIVLYIFHKSP